MRLNCMKIVTLNLRHDKDRWEERRPLVIAELSRLDADVIAFQEVAMLIGQAHELAARLGETTGRPYEALAQVKPEPESKEGIAVLTRLEVIDNQRRELPGGHRIAQRVIVRGEAGPVNIVNTHLHHRPIGSERTRLKQARHLLAWFDTWPDDAATVLLGDMNARPDSDTIGLLKGRFASAYESFHGREPDATFPTPLVRIPWPGRALDYIFYSPGRFRVVEARLAFTEPSPGDDTLYPSDHYGVWSLLRPLQEGQHAIPEGHQIVQP